MEWEERSLQRSVREGYTVLLRAKAKLLLPQSCNEIRQFYERCAEAGLAWAEEVYGERVRADFLGREGIVQRSQFRTHLYCFDMQIPWQELPLVAILCESQRGVLGTPFDRFCIAHVWNLDEQTVLPKKQALQALGANARRRDIPFRYDGFYREGDKLVIFQNPTAKSKFLEARLPLDVK